MKKVIYLIALLGVVASCTFSDNQYANQLKQLDEQLEDNPQLVWDSLKKMDPSQMNTPQQAYYYLLNASATNKNLAHLEDDSTLRVALEYFEDKQDLYNLARCQYYLGKYVQKKQQTKEAYEYFIAAELNFTQSKSNNIHLLGLIHYQLALLQKQQKNLEKAKILFQKSFNEFIEAKDTISATYPLRYIGTIQDKDHYKQGENFLFKSLELISNLKEGDQEKIYLSKIGILSSLSLFYLRNNNLEQSLDYSHKCLSLFLQQEKEIPSQYYCNLSQAFHKTNQLDSTKYYTNKLINAARKENNLFNLINGYKILSKLEEKVGNYKEAYSLIYKINSLKDSLNDTKNKNNIIELEKKHNLVKSQKLIYKAEKNKWKAYTAASLILLVIFVIGFPLYSRHRRLKLKYNQLSKAVKHTEWGFLVTKEFITGNHIAYDELERMLNREKSLKNINSELYNRFHEAIIQQKADYSGRLIDRLTSFDGAFATKFQQLFPEFTTDDLLMASMIHHKWKITDMTTIFHSSLDAIRKRKARLSQKISAKLKKEIDLDDYLTNL